MVVIADSMEKRNFGVFVSQTLSKDVNVSTDTYRYIGYEEGIDKVDTEEVNWEKVYKDDRHYTPIELIKLFKSYLEEKLSNNNLPLIERTKALHLVSECSDWVEDETIIEEA